MKVSVAATWFVTFFFISGFECNDSIYEHYQRARTFDYPDDTRPPPPAPPNVKYTRKQWLCFILGVCSTTLLPDVIPPAYAEMPALKLINQWNQLEFDYEYPYDRQSDIDSGQFTPGVIAPIDVDVYYPQSSANNQIFVTIPRFVEGVPATLGTVTGKYLNGNPLIKPYPSWSWHKKSEQCLRDRLVSVFRVKIDECSRLWVLDTGNIGSKYVCPPQIIAFDLKTNQVVHRHEFPADVVTGHHLLVTPMVDVRDPQAGCRDTFVYVADVLGFALLVYDVARGRSWRIQDKTFYPYPTFGTYNIAGESFDLMDGILGLALSPYTPRQDRVLFYHAMSSPTENWVYTSNLRNQTLFSESDGTAPYIFNTFTDRRNTQSAAEAIDKNGIMFFGMLQDLQIACWDTNTEYGPKNFDIVASNSVTLQFPSGMKVVINKKGQQELWILTSRFQKVANGSLNPREPNFRIQAGKVDDLLHGTKCKGRPTGGGYGLYSGPKG